MSVMQVIVFHSYTKFEVRRPSRSEDIADFGSSLVTLTFDLLTFKCSLRSPVSWASFLSIFSFLCLSILNLGSGMGQTDRRTERQRPSTLFYSMGRGILIIIIIFSAPIPRARSEKLMQKIKV